jgi:lipopolysaccharide export system protein LptA
MKHLLAAFLTAIVCALSSAGALAEKADRNKPMNVEADALRYDDLNQTSVFTGKVVVTKGSILIRGAKVDVRQDPEGYQFGTVTAEPGKLAYFKQKREGMDEYIEGEGEVIEYDGKADRVKFIKRAEMRRLRGASVADEMTGSLITYDNSNDVFTVDGGAGAPGLAPGLPGGRIRAVLAPRTTASAPAAAPTPPAAVQLRQSRTIGGEKR